MNVQGFGAGVGRVGPYFEQGNWYRGGAVQMLFITWIYGEQNQVRPMFPQGHAAGGSDRARRRLFDLAPQLPPVDWDKALWHLPVQDIIKNVDGPRGIFADAMPVETGGMMQQRDAERSARGARAACGTTTCRSTCPGLWFMSWYDVSVGPEPRALQPRAQDARSADVADQQWAVIAPVAHCAYTRATENTIVGERSMGDARLDYDEIIYGFFDQFLKGDDDGRLDTLPKVTYFTMGIEQVADLGHLAAGGRAADDVLPVERRQGQHAERRRRAGDRAAGRRQARRVHLRSDEPGARRTAATSAARATRSAPGRSISARWKRAHDILVYTSEPFKEGIEVSGPITPTLYVSSDAKDTDFTVKVLDVYPDGRAYNLDESIQRMRYRDGYDKPLVWMEKGKVYKVDAAAANDEQLLRGRASPAHRGVEQQLPALRSQPEHRRQQLRRGEGRRRAQRRAPLEAVPVEGDRSAS